MKVSQPAQSNEYAAGGGRGDCGEYTSRSQEPLDFCRDSILILLPGTRRRHLRVGGRRLNEEEITSQDRFCWLPAGNVIITSPTRHAWGCIPPSLPYSLGYTPIAPDTRVISKDGYTILVPNIFRIVAINSPLSLPR